MPARRSKKVKNLEEEVKLIFSQDESDEDCKTIVNINKIQLRTPSKMDATKGVVTPRASQAVLQEMLQTPRRSCRKSVKPTQEYEDIVRKSLRSFTRSGKKNLSAYDVNEDEENQNDEVVAPRWTPAKVGRVSQKRSRKSRRTVKGKKQYEKETKQLIEQKKYGEKNNVLEVGIEFSVKADKFVDGINEQKNDGILEVKEMNLLKPISQESNEVYKQRDQNQLQLPEEIIEQKEVDEIVDNMGHLNVKTEYNYQENDVNLIREQKETDNKPDDVTKNHDSIILIQDDSEDRPELVAKSEQEEICIVYESNISSEDIKNNEDDIQSLYSKSIKNVKNVDKNFGSYLKSQEINISDLGLNPIKDEEEEKENVEVHEQMKSFPLGDEDMPSLIVCDDENEIEDVKPSNKLNETFEKDGEIVESFFQTNEEAMETLQLSDDDGEVIEKRPCVILTDTELQNHLLLSSHKTDTIKSKLPTTPKASTFKHESKRKQATKEYRLPSPYVKKRSYKLKKEEKENVPSETSNKTFSNAPMISLTTLEPREIILRGIRKRSLSVCINGDGHKIQKFLSGHPDKIKQDRIVSFYSPANQTTVIDELDIKIAKSLKKQKSENKDSSNKYVTTRRQRSISFDDSINSTVLCSKLPRPALNQNIGSNPKNFSFTSKPLPRTKLPNFAAIHQKQFQKMENLVEHVNRKQERSKNLINSATKLKPVSAQKGISIKNNSNISTEKSKAIKKIDLGTMSQMNKSVLNSTATKAIPNKTQDSRIVTHLPDPRVGTVKPIKAGTISRISPQQQQIKKYLKPLEIANIEKPRLNTKTVAPQPKPTFNLSTSLMVKPKISSSNFVGNTNISHVSNDKMASRLQRHMNLFKGRVPSSRAGVASRKNEVILKGVRSNRRFELQMQHRKNLEQ